MLRRRFMLVCTAAVTGLWFRPTGLTTLSRKIVIALSGSCSFCGKSIERVQSIAGAVGSPTRICDECVGLCLDILDEEVEWLRPRDPKKVPPREEIDRDSEEEAILRNLQKVRAAIERGPSKHGGRAYASEIDAMIADSRRRIDGARRRSLEQPQPPPQPQPQPSTSSYSYSSSERSERSEPPRASNSNLVCSFCNAHQRDVKKLIAGPTVYICDGCVGEAAVVTQALIDRSRLA